LIQIKVTRIAEVPNRCYWKEGSAMIKLRSVNMRELQNMNKRGANQAPSVNPAIAHS
jgi:hypothetical protein